jgi:hypothetical protein
MRAPSRWPLAGLLAVAAAREGTARTALGAALAERGQVAAERHAASDALLRHREESVAAAARGAGAGPTAATLAGRARHAARLGAEEARLAAALRRRQAALAAAEGQVERRREALGTARAEARALEARREAWRAARARDRARADEDAVNEAVSARSGAGW